jgi:hypothetical protein
VIIDYYLSKSKANSDLWLQQGSTSSARWCPLAQFMIHLSDIHLHDAIQKHGPLSVPSSLVGLKTRIQLTCFVLWLYGPAGAGKSAILQSIAEECCSLDGRFGGSFFSRGKAGRDQSHLLFNNCLPTRTQPSVSSKTHRRYHAGQR